MVVEFSLEWNANGQRAVFVPACSGSGGAKNFQAGFSFSLTVVDFRSKQQVATFQSIGAVKEYFECLDNGHEV